MSAPPLSTPARSFSPLQARVLAHVRTPLYRNGYALVFSSGATSGLGMVYWIVAARLYSTEAIGLNSALIAAMIFLANISQLNLMNALNRFLPNAGRATGRLIGIAYAISAVVAVGTSLVFIAGLKAWSPTLSFLGASPGLGLWFGLATLMWCLFVLQDSALTGLRQATWVPVENLLFALAKIGLLVALAGAAPRFGVFASWTLAVAIALLPTNLLIFRRIVPRHVQATAAHAEPVVPGQIARYVAGDYLGSLISLAASNLLPIIVIERAGASANAYFYLAWTIAYTFYLISRNMGQSLIAEAAADMSQLNAYSYRTFVQTARLLVPLVAGVVIGAPFILRLFGPKYASEGATLLQLLCLSALPNMITSLYASVARVQRRIAALLLVQSALAGLVFGLSYFLLDRVGIVGVGIAWLASQSLIAGLLLVTELRAMWLSQLNLRGLIGWLAIPRGWWWALRHRRHIAQARSLLPVLQPAIAAPSATDWVAQRLMPTVGDMTVVTLGKAGHTAVAVLKLPQSRRGTIGLRQHARALTALHADARLGKWRTLLPTLLAQGQVNGQAYVVEKLMPGVLAESLLDQGPLGARALAACAAAIGELHRRTAAQVAVTEAHLAGWVDSPLATLRLLNTARLGQRYGQGLDRLGVELRAALTRRTLAVGWAHNDFAPGNVLMAEDGASVTGIVDWEMAGPDELPHVDVVFLLLAARVAQERRELGDVVRDLLRGGAWSEQEQHILQTAQAALPGEAIDPRALVQLAWLRHVAANLNKSDAYAGQWLWISQNIESVLQEK